jgi:hypothetical protein
VCARTGSRVSAAVGRGEDYLGADGRGEEQRRRILKRLLLLFLMTITSKAHNLSPRSRWRNVACLIFVCICGVRTHITVHNRVSGARARKFCGLDMLSEFDCVLLSGGIGHGLYPLSEDIPKVRVFYCLQF